MAKKKAKKKEFKKMRTPTFRVSFPALYEPKDFEDGKKPKYGVVMLFDSDADLAEMRAEARKAAIAMFGPKEDWPENFKWPFRNGDKKKDQEGYAGKTFVRASTDRRPGVLDKDKTPSTAEDNALYAGCYARATVVCAAFDAGGGKGVTFYLNNIIKIKDGKEFSGRASAEEDFADLEIEDEEGEESEDDADDEDSMW